MAVGKREAFIPIKGTSIRTCNCTILFISYTHHSRMEDFDPSGVVRAHSGGDDRGRASTCFVGGGGVVGGPLTLRGRTLRGDARWPLELRRWRPWTSFNLFCWRRRSCWRTFDPQGSYAERGRPITTGALEVTTLQLRFDGRGGGGGGARGPLTLRGRTLRGDARWHWSSRGERLWTSFNFVLSKTVQDYR